ncbi:hypothetical protein HY635_02550 [Candidatus Uhrbacteria bacterium]|nr:hypothetical protein [Candidatus Uhrbacteria bacterium]
MTVSTRKRTIATLIIAAAISIPTAFYAAKNTSTSRAPPKTVTLDEQIVECKKVAKDTEKRGACYSAAEGFCRSKRGQEKRSCDLRVRREKQVDETAIGLTECGTRSGAQVRKCAQKVWKDLGRDMAMTAAQRGQVCGGLAGIERDRCTMHAVLQGVRNGESDRSSCAAITNEELRIVCQEGD